MDEHIVIDESGLSEGDRVVTEIEGREIAVFRVNGELYAYLNWCAHQGGPCCEGKLTGTLHATYDRGSNEVSLRWDREDEILNCPWHGWEYDITTGECLSRTKISLPAYPVELNNGNIVVKL